MYHKMQGFRKLVLYFGFGISTITVVKIENQFISLHQIVVIKIKNQKGIQRRRILKRLSLWDCQGSGVSAYYRFKRLLVPNSPWII